VHIVTTWLQRVKRIEKNFRRKEHDKGRDVRKESNRRGYIFVVVENLVLYTAVINTKITSHSSATPLVTRMYRVLQCFGATIPCKSL
jgi:hypothetical protein